MNILENYHKFLTIPPDHAHKDSASLFEEALFITLARSLRQIECLDQEDRHLVTSDRAVRAVIAIAAAGSDPFQG